MKTYEIYDNSVEKVAVKRGLCWPGVFFGVFWSLWKKLWLLSTVILISDIVVIALVGASGASDEVIFATVGMCNAFWPFYLLFRGNAHRRNKLVKSGYKLTGIVVAANAATAIQQSVINKQ